MISKHLALALALVGSLTASARSQQEEPLPSLPSPEATEEKVVALNEGLSTLKGLQATLRNLGSPIKKEDGESNSAFLKRVDRILKGRALAVTLVGQEIERVLDAKFQLQAQLAEYETWAMVVQKQLHIVTGDHEKRQGMLQTRFAEARPDVIVLAHLLFEELKATSSEQASNYEPYFKTHLEGLTDAAARRQKFQALPLAEKQKAFDQFLQVMVDSQFEIELLEKVVIVEDQGFKDILPAEHQKAIADAKAILEHNQDLKGLGDKAAQVAIIAKYTAQNLNLVQPGEGLEPLVRVLKELRETNPIVEAVLNELVANKISVRGRGRIMDWSPKPAEASDSSKPAVKP
jgi:hypothetical protein